LNQGHQAMAIALQYLYLSPSSSHGYVLKARTPFSLDQDEETLQVCEQVLVLIQNEEEAWLYTAITLTRLGPYEKSSPAYTQGIFLLSGTVPPRSVEACMGMLLASKMLKRHQRALKAYHATNVVASPILTSQETLVNLQQDINHLQQRPPDSRDNAGLPGCVRRLPFLPCRRN